MFLVCYMIEDIDFVFGDNGVTKRADNKRTKRVLVLMSSEDVAEIRGWMIRTGTKSFGDAVRRLSAVGLRVENEGAKNERGA